MCALTRVVYLIDWMRGVAERSENFVGFSKLLAYLSFFRETMTGIEDLVTRSWKDAKYY